MHLSQRRLALAGVCLLALGCPRNPATGARQLNFVSKDQEIKIGKEGATEVASSMGLYENEALQRYVGEVGGKLSGVSERPGLPWSFQVVDDTIVNAFALPGGPIFITRGLLAHLENEAQLAIVLGHEVGHVTAEHSVNQMSKAQIAQVGIGLGAIVSQQLAGLGAQGLQLLFLKYGRDDERQSDTLALRYGGRAGYDVRAAPEVFEVLRRVSASGPGDRVPSWLATHPDPEERVKNMQKQLEKLPPDQTAGKTIEEERFKRALDGLVYGDDPREGIVQGTRFIHPGLRFSIDFPDGYKVVNSKSQVVAQHPNGEAAMELTMATEPNVEAALAAFFKDSGATPTGAPGPLGGATAQSFTGKSESGEVGGVVAFLRDGDRTLRFLFVAPAQAAGTHRPGFDRLVTSYARVTDPGLLNAQPRRLKVDRLNKTVSVRELQAAHPAVPAEELALINQVALEATLQPGRLVKWVVAP